MDQIGLRFSHNNEVIKASATLVGYRLWQDSFILEKNESRLNRFSSFLFFQIAIGIATTI